MSVKSNSVPEMTAADIAEAKKAFARLNAWLDSQKPTPPNAKEKVRMAAAIEFDLQQCVLRGIDVQERIKKLDYCGYLYEGMTFKVPE